MAYRQGRFIQTKTLFSTRRALAIVVLFWTASVILITQTFMLGDKNKRSQCPKSVITMMDMNRGLTENLWGYSTLWALQNLNMTNKRTFIPFEVLNDLHQYFKPLSLDNLDTLPESCILQLKGIKVIQPTDLELESTDHSTVIDFNLDSAGYARPVVYAKASMASEFKFVDDLILYAESLILSGIRMMRRIRRPAEMVVGVWVSKTVYKAPLDFYVSAMYAFRALGRTLFVIVGDTKWAEENLNFPDTILCTPGNSGFDLAVMSLCNHTILDFGDLAIWAGLRSPGTKYIYSIRPSLVKVLEAYGEWFIYIEKTISTDTLNKTGLKDNKKVITLGAIKMDPK